MAKRAGVITINVNAGTAELVQDLNAAGATVRRFGQQQAAAMGEFGTASRSSMIESSAALRAMEGNFSNNIRAVERFTSVTLGLGPVFKAIFPVIGGAALIGMFVEAGNSAYQFFKTMQEAPAKVVTAFRELNAPLAITNDQLRVANDRLEQDIAKLEGRRQNNLKLALDEARLSADQLAESLDKDLKAAEAALKDNSVGVMRRMLGDAGIKDLEEGMRDFREKVAQASDTGTAVIAAAPDKDSAKEARKQFNTAQLANYTQEQARLNKELEKALALQRESDSRDHGIGAALTTPIGEQHADQSSRIRALRGEIRGLDIEKEGIQIRSDNEDLTAKKEDLTAGAANDKLDKPFKDKMAGLRAEIDATNDKFKAIGTGWHPEIMAKGTAAAVLAIAELNKMLERHKVALTEDEKAQLTFTEQFKAQGDADLEFKTKNDASTRSLDERIIATQLLTEAMGRGYEATKAARVEAKLAAELGEKYSDQQFGAAHPEVFSTGRKKFGDEIDAEQGQQIKSATLALNDQIEVEKQLAQMKDQASKVAERSALVLRLEQLARDKGTEATRKQVEAELALFDAKKATLDASQLAKLNDQIDAVKALAAAELRGAEATRKAALENKYQKMADDGVSPEVMVATRTLDILENQKAVTKEALATGMAHKDTLEKLLKQRDVLAAVKKGEVDVATLEISRRENQDAILKSMADQALALGTAKDGIRAFFLEMQASSVKVGVMLNDSLHSAVDGLADSLSKVATGQKGGWGKMLQQVGQQGTQAAIKNALHAGIGAIGQRLGIGAPPTKKPTGNPGDPVHVFVDNGGPGAGAPFGLPGGFPVPDPLQIPGIGGALGRVAGTFGGGALGGGIMSLLRGVGGGDGASATAVTSSINFGGPMEAGGDVSAGEAYDVGERGPEPFIPKTDGTIIPTKGFGGTTHNYFTNVSAGVDIQTVEAAVRRGSQTAYQASVQHSAQLADERRRRTPQ